MGHLIAECKICVFLDFSTSKAISYSSIILLTLSIMRNQKNVPLSKLFNNISESGIFSKT